MYIYICPLYPQAYLFPVIVTRFMLSIRGIWYHCPIKYWIHGGVQRSRWRVQVSKGWTLQFVIRGGRQFPLKFSINMYLNASLSTDVLNDEIHFNVSIYGRPALPKHHKHTTLNDILYVHGIDYFSMVYIAWPVIGWVDIWQWTIKGLSRINAQTTMAWNNVSQGKGSKNRGW